LASIFIDGQAGTTGLEISERLSRRSDVTLLEIDPGERKNAAARRCLSEAADVTVLCLPDAAACEATALAKDSCRLLDASSAHRIAEGWVYGCPELNPGQRSQIRNARRVSNPGCYPQGFILLVRPLIEAGILAPETCLSVFALSGYSGGGRQLVEKYRALSAEQRESWNTRPYALSLGHKHVPEMQRYSGTGQAPLFCPSVGNFYRGMLVQVPLFKRQLNSNVDAADIRALLGKRYAEEDFVDVLPLNPGCALEDGFLNATQLNGSNRIEFMVYANEEQILLLARYDNLGKGAAGAAIQNLNIMLGLDESLGLEA
jgi:N-acetyl-gamma-glutamyl-phosphate reductase